MSFISDTTPDSTTTVKGKVQLAGSLGGTAALPTTITYGSGTSNVATDETTTSTSYTGLTTPQTVTVTVGASGMLLIGYGAQMYNTSAQYMAYALSSANTYSASDNDIAFTSSNSTGSMTKLHTGLTPGSTVVTAQFRVDSGTGHWLRRHLWAVPL